MFQINAVSKFVDLKNSFRIYYVIAIGILVAVLVLLTQKDLLGMVTVLACTVVLYFVLAQSPKVISIIFEEEKMIIGGEKIAWNKCLGWAMVELDSKLEFIVQTSQITQSFYYFYLDKDEPFLKELILELTQYLHYQSDIADKNWLHNFMRTFGLK